MAISTLNRPLLVLILNDAMDEARSNEFLSKRVYEGAYSVAVIRDLNEVGGTLSKFIDDSRKEGMKGFEINRDFYVAVAVNIEDDTMLLEKTAGIAKEQFKLNGAGFFFDVYALLDERTLSAEKTRKISEALALLDKTRDNFKRLTEPDQSMDSVFYVISNCLYTSGRLHYLEKIDIERMILRHLFVNAHSEPYMRRDAFYNNMFAPTKMSGGKPREGFCTIGYKRIIRQDDAVTSFIMSKIIADSGFDEFSREDNKYDESLIDIKVRYTSENSHLDGVLKTTDMFTRMPVLLALPIKNSITKKGTLDRRTFIDDYFGEGTFEMFMRVNCNDVFDQCIGESTQKFSDEVKKFTNGGDNERVNFYRVYRYLSGKCIKDITEQIKAADSKLSSTTTDYNNYMQGPVDDIAEKFVWPKEFAKQDGNGINTKLVYSVAFKAAQLYTSMKRNAASLRLVQNWLDIVNDYKKQYESIYEQLKTIKASALKKFNAVSKGDNLFSIGFADDCARRITKYSKANNDRINKFSDDFYSESKRKHLDEYIRNEAAVIKAEYWEDNQSFYEECVQRFNSANKHDELNAEIENYLTRDKVYCLSVDNSDGTAMFEPVCFIYKNTVDKDNVSKIYENTGGRVENETGIKFFRDVDSADETDIFVLYVKGCFHVKHICSGRYAGEDTRRKTHG